MTEAQVSSVLLDALPGDAQGKLLAEELSSKDVASILQANLSPERKAILIADADPKGSAKALKKNYDRDQIDRLLQESLPDAEKAKVLAAELSSEEVAQVVGEISKSQKRLASWPKRIPKRSRARSGGSRLPRKSPS